VEHEPPNPDSEKNAVADSGTRIAHLEALRADIRAEVKQRAQERDNFSHDESGAVNAGIPEPPVVGASIARLDKLVTALQKPGCR
jgi:hypothetical protein